jgi:RND family efflux transporter MFP subunit
VSALLKPEGAPVREGETLFRVDRSDPGESFLTTPVVSPIKGWVGRWMVLNIGQQITPNDPVVTVVDDTALRATISLPVSEWLAMTEDTKVRVKVEEEIREARVISVARAGDTASARGTVVVEVPNEEHTWRAGMVGLVELDLQPRDRMMIPASALTITDQGAFVFVADGDKAKRLEVEFQVIDSDTVEITKGIADKAEVVVVGANLLSPDAPINVIETKEM